MRRSRRPQPDWSAVSVQEKELRYLAASLEPDLLTEIMSIAPFVLILAVIFTPLTIISAFVIYFFTDAIRAGRQEQVLRDKIAALSEVIVLLDGRIKTAMTDRSDNISKLKSVNRRIPPFSNQAQNLPTRTNHAPHNFKTGSHKIPSHVKVYS